MSSLLEASKKKSGEERSEWAEIFLKKHPGRKTLT